MIFGIPTLMEFPEAEPLIRFCAELGFPFAELYTRGCSLNIK